MRPVTPSRTAAPGREGRGQTASPRRRGTSRIPQASVLLALLAGCGSVHLAVPLLPVATTLAPAPPLVRVWETDVDGAFGPSAPVTGAAMIAVGTREGRAVVLDVATGRRLGALDVGSSVEGGLAVAPDGRTLFVPVSRGRYGVVAHGLVDGQRRWAWRGDGPAETADAGLALAGGVLVVPLHSGATLGLDAATGTVRWRATGAAGAQNHAAPVLLPGGGVAVVDDHGAVRALDAATGTVLWSAAAGAPVYAALTSAGTRLLAATTRGTLVALDAATGRTLWTAALDPAGRARVTQASADATRAVVGLTDGRVVALDLATGAPVWTWSGADAVVGAPLVSGPTVYVGTTGRHVVALDAASGAETFRVDVRGRVKSGLVAAAGRLLVLSEPRHVTAFDTAPAARP